MAARDRHQNTVLKAAVHEEVGLGVGSRSLPTVRGEEPHQLENMMPNKPKVKLARVDEEGNRWCSAKKVGQDRHCKQRAIPGGNVCRYHGGKAPQVIKKALERLEDILDPHRAWRAVAAIAYFDPADVYDSHGNILPVNEWPEKARLALSSFEVVKRNLTKGDDATDEILKVRMWDKVRGLEMILKRLGEMQEKLEHSGQITFQWQGAGGTPQPPIEAPTRKALPESVEAEFVVKDE